MNFLTKYSYLKKRRHFIKKEVADVRNIWKKKKYWLSKYNKYLRYVSERNIKLPNDFNFPIKSIPSKEYVYRTYSQRFSHSIFSLNIWRQFFKKQNFSIKSNENTNKYNNLNSNFKNYLWNYRVRYFSSFIYNNGLPDMENNSKHYVLDNCNNWRQSSLKQRYQFYLKYRNQVYLGLPFEVIELFNFLGYNEGLWLKLIKPFWYYTYKNRLRTFNALNFIYKLKTKILENQEKKWQTKQLDNVSHIGFFDNLYIYRNYIDNQKIQALTNYTLKGNLTPNKVRWNFLSYNNRKKVNFIFLNRSNLICHNLHFFNNFLLLIYCMQFKYNFNFDKYMLGYVIKQSKLFNSVNFIYNFKLKLNNNNNIQFDLCNLTKLNSILSIKLLNKIYCKNNLKLRLFNKPSSITFLKLNYQRFSLLYRFLVLQNLNINKLNFINKLQKNKQDLYYSYIFFKLLYLIFKYIYIYNLKKLTKK